MSDWSADVCYSDLGSRQAPTRHRWPVGCPLPDNGAGNLHRQGRRNCSMTAQAFADQVSLLVRAIPEIAREDIFALKGGTAINLFVRDLPRLSVDIDLVYLPVADRDSSLQAVRDGLERIASRLERGGRMTVERRLLPDGKRLVVQSDGVMIKLEEIGRAHV